MKNTNIETSNHIQSIFLKENLKIKLSKNFEKMFNKILENINKPGDVLNIFSKDFKFNFKLRDLKKFKAFKQIAIIGMGGSILGAEAIHHFLKRKIRKKVYFFDDLNSENVFEIKKMQTKKILFIVISKSGNTTETILNLVSLNIVKKNSKNIIVITEKNNNPLHKMSKKMNLFFIEHKKFIGGRYSVLSEVGILPSHLMGIQTNSLRKNIRRYLKGEHKKFLKESTLKLANIMISGKKRNLIFLNYEPRLEKFLYWCQQLIAESLGKKKKGFLPIISNNPKDHHSLLQLYLDGPRDKIFHILSFEDKFEKKYSIRKFFNNLSYLNNKSINKVKNVQKNSLIKVLKIKNIPFREFKIKNINEETLGELFAYFILETIIIGKLARINPFNQPAVEQVKIITKRFLS